MAQFSTEFAGSTRNAVTAERVERLRQLQFRLDALLSGDATPAEGARTEEYYRPFAQFLPRDQHRASALAALCMKVAEEEGGVRGLEMAIDELYERLGRRPAGMVQYAAKLFLTHFGPAREHLEMRSLERRQPGSVQPS